MYNSDSPSDRAAANRAYDAQAEQDEIEQDHVVLVTITREYEGTFWGTKAHAVELAKEYFKRKDGEFEAEVIAAEIREEL